MALTLNHDQAKTLIQKRLSGRLDRFEHAALDEHLQDCSACAKYAHEQHALDRRLSASLRDRWPAPVFPPAAMANKLAGIHHHRRRDTMKRTFYSAAALAAGAAALVLLVAGLYWLTQSAGPNSIPGATSIETPTATAVQPSPTPEATATDAPTATGLEGQVSVEDAERLVRDYIFEHNPDMNPDVKFNLNEFTPANVWEAMQIQLFKVTGDTMLYETFVIARGGEVVMRIGEAFGGMGVGDVNITDLDGNGQPEMFFTANFGSGRNISLAGVVVEDGEGYRELRMPAQGMRMAYASPDRVEVTMASQQGPAQLPAGLLKLASDHLYIASDDPAYATYFDETIGLSFFYPAAWGADGGDLQVDLGAAGNSERACEWKANTTNETNPTVPRREVTRGEMMVCVIRNIEGGASQSSLIYFPLSLSPETHGVITLPSEQVDMVVATMMLKNSGFTGGFPYPNGGEIPANVPMPELTESSAADLKIEEWKVVSAYEDTPNRYEFDTRIPEAVKDRNADKRGWGNSFRLDEANRALEKFGYRLDLDPETYWATLLKTEANGSETVLAKEINYFSRVTYYLDRNGVGDFALRLDTNEGSYLASKAAFEPYDAALHCFHSPVYAGEGRLITVECHRGDEGFQFERVVIKQNGEEIFSYMAGDIMVTEAVKSLNAWEGRWVVEINGTLVVDGAIYNLKDLPATKIHDFSLLNDKAFFFYEQNGAQTRVMYNGQDLGLAYDEVIHYRCCEPAMFNPSANGQMVWFYARKAGYWYYVEITQP
jgi:hypothetical protein